MISPNWGTRGSTENPWFHHKSARPCCWRVLEKAGEERDGKSYLTYQEIGFSKKNGEPWRELDYGTIKATGIHCDCLGGLEAAQIVSRMILPILLEGESRPVCCELPIQLYSIHICKLYILHPIRKKVWDCSIAAEVESMSKKEGVKLSHTKKWNLSLGGGTFKSM